MKMGLERGILRWDIHASVLSARLSRVEASLRAASTAEPEGHSEKLRALLRERDDLLRARSALGPSPRAKMG